MNGCLKFWLLLPILCVLALIQMKLNQQIENK